MRPTFYFQKTICKSVFSSYMLRVYLIYVCSFDFFTSSVMECIELDPERDMSYFPLNCTLYGSLTMYRVFEEGQFPGDKTTLHISSEGRNYIDVFHLYRKHYYIRLDMHGFYERIIGHKMHVRALSISDVKEKNHIKRKKEPVVCRKHDGNEQFPRLLVHSSFHLLKAKIHLTQV